MADIANVIDKLKEAVVTGRRMRALQTQYFRKRDQTSLISAKEAERLFDEQSLAALNLEQAERDARTSDA